MGRSAEGGRVGRSAEGGRVGRSAEGASPTMCGWLDSTPYRVCWWDSPLCGCVPLYVAASILSAQSSSTRGLYASVNCFCTCAGTGS